MLRKAKLLLGLALVLVFASLGAYALYAQSPPSVEEDPLVRMPGTQPNQVSLEGPNRCMNCHGDYDQAVEPFFNWHGSMMAHASRDPLFEACLTIANQDIPGVDKIGGNRPAERFYKVISSAAYNWDKALVMSETYGAMGDIDWETIYHVAMEQYTKGINQLIPHAVWYDNTKVTFKPDPQIFEQLIWARYLADWPGPAEGERPSAYIVVLGDTTIRPNFGCDHGIAAQSMMLGAVEKGLAGCMIGSVKREGLREALQMPAIGDVRGLGLMVGVELKTKSGQYLAALAEKGVLALPAGGNVIRYLPPLVISEEDIDAVIAATIAVLTA